VNRLDLPWIDRYMITSLTGRVYSRRMMYNAVSRLIGPGKGFGIRELLDDDSFMRPKTGMIPRAVAWDIYIKLIETGAWEKNR
jgi:hypothetical protein